MTSKDKLKKDVEKLLDSCCYTEDATGYVRIDKTALGKLVNYIKQRELDAITDYWLENYLEKDMCSLCGNNGRIDTRGVCTNAGLKVGKVNYCICPNGQVYRKQELSKITKFNK